MAADIVIPFIGISFTVASILVAAVAIVVGFILGSSAKNGLKLVVLFIGFISLLFLLGFIPVDVTDKLKEIFFFLQPLISSSMTAITAVSGTGGIPTIIMAFAIGVILGWWKS